MYPDFQYLFQSLLGTDLPAWLSLFKTFGFLVALSFIAAAYTLVSELKRKEQAGLLTYTEKIIWKGKKATTQDYFIQALIGFLLAYKIGGIIQNTSVVALNPLAFILSFEGTLGIGILGALITLGMKYFEEKKNQLEKPIQVKIKIYPHQRINDIVMVAAIGGIIGAKVFNAFETWDQFIQNPIEQLIASSGLTFYGGLIIATLALYRYAKKHQINFAHLCDAAAPGLMLAYGIGRLGCHFAGDGDWGIYNSAYISKPDGTLQYVSTDTFEQVAHQAAPYMTYINNTVAPHMHVAAPSWLPNWLFGMNYAHNVNHEGMPLVDCVGNYCTALPVSVFPTPLYEAIVCILLFALIWKMRTHFQQPLKLFGLYLMLNGAERFFVELIRVNSQYNWGFIHPTQAEIISVCLLSLGAYFFLRKEKNSQLP
ncbi:MAG: prolipoprotein diacylglyceryl transferase [Bacteroidota bacterium]|nr:prolipoprotein diacylglyceryl transferase [Bacteroidota bacterium]